MSPLRAKWSKTGMQRVLDEAGLLLGSLSEADAKLTRCHARWSKVCTRQAVRRRFMDEVRSVVKQRAMATRGHVASRRLRPTST